MIGRILKIGMTECILGSGAQDKEQRIQQGRAMLREVDNRPLMKIDPGQQASGEKSPVSE